MADNPTARKRSRSPTDADHQNQNKQAKRLNLGSDSDEHEDRPDDAKPEKDEKDATMHDNSASNGDANGNEQSSATGSNPDKPKDSQVPQTHINMRCLIVTQDASIIIGRAGTHVNEIRQKSGAKVMVSESIPGNPERILNVGGPLDAVSKAFGLIVRRINDEPFDVPSVPGSRAVTIKFMIPNSRMGSVIGKGGTKIKEIQEASGARLNASEGVLPGSTERVLSVAGVADAIHIATYYIGNILIEANERNPTPSTSQTSYRPSSSTRGPPRGGGGGGGGGVASHNPYAPPPPQQPYPSAGGPPPQANFLQEQKIYIPNDFVGCIIGKGGSKINEIRQLSQCTIKIMEPAPNGDKGDHPERLVVVTGQPNNIQMAVGMLYNRLEQEKQKQLGSRSDAGR